MHQIFLEYTPKIEQFSIDECFLDVTNYLPKGKNLLQIAYEINQRIYQELGFTVNVGVAHNKLLAKMASDFEKPNKVHTLYEEEIPEKMWKLPITVLATRMVKSCTSTFPMALAPSLTSRVLPLLLPMVQQSSSLMILSGMLAGILTRR